MLFITIVDSVTACCVVVLVQAARRWLAPEQQCVFSDRCTRRHCWQCEFSQHDSFDHTELQHRCNTDSECSSVQVRTIGCNELLCVGSGMQEGHC